MEPRPHQRDAIKACVAGLKKPGSRGQCLMACGTGKTLVGLETARELKVKRVLVLVPSILLVQQMIRAYRAQGVENILAICSAGVADDEDTIRVSVAELGEDLTTDANAARAFLAGSGQRVVVCTYQSLPALSDLFQTLEFDLAIFDEAHKTAGVKGKAFAHGLTDDILKCKRRLFMTATPRHATLRADSKETEVFSMSDPKVYGAALYTLSLREAIEKGLITDYRIIVVGVEKQIDEALQMQATRVALEKAMLKYKVSKVFTFHARIAHAKAFIEGATCTLHTTRLLHINGEQTQAERNKILQDFTAAKRAILTNAQCLTEGIDVPAAEMVAFMSPKDSYIAVVQALGRVLRKHASKAEGSYVFLPVFIDARADAQALQESDFAGVYEVLQALREQDSVLATNLAKAAWDLKTESAPFILDLGNLGHHCDDLRYGKFLHRNLYVRLVQSFGRDSKQIKASLLQRARDGKGPPKGYERRLICQYANPRQSVYDAIFIETLKALAPTWFQPPAEATRSKLIMLAEKRAPKPVSGTPERSALYAYTTPTHCCYRAEFAQRLRKLAPHWFQDKTNIDCKHVVNPTAKKEALRAAAQKKVARKALSRPLQIALSGYLYPRSPMYDAALATQLRTIAPHWFRKARRIF